MLLDLSPFVLGGWLGLFVHCRVLVAFLRNTLHFLFLPWCWEKVF